MRALSPHTEMRAVIFNFLSLRAENVSTEVWVGLAVVYAILVGLTLSSIWAGTWSKSASWLWTLVVLCLPSLVIFIYSLASLACCDFSVLKQFGFGASHERHQAIRNK